MPSAGHNHAPSPGPATPGTLRNGAEGARSTHWQALRPAPPAAPNAAFDFVAVDRCSETGRPPVQPQGGRAWAAGLLLFPQFVDAGGEGSVLLFVVREGDAEAEEGGRPFADVDAPAVGAGEVCVRAGFGFEAGHPADDGEA